MPKQRVLLICSQRLFGESMEMVLRRATGIEVIGPWDLDDTVCSRIPEADPRVVVIAEEDPNNEKSVYLAATIMEQYPDLPVICMGLAENVFRVFSTRTLPARSTDLLEAILGLETRSPEPNEDMRKIPMSNSKQQKRDLEQKLKE